MAPPPFTLFVAADVWSTKLNLELAFPDKPGRAPLVAAVEAAFSAEMRRRCPPEAQQHLRAAAGAAAAAANAPPLSFVVEKLKLFNEATGKWSALSTETHAQRRLADGAQIYAFMPESPAAEQWHPESTDPIPPPVRPATAPLAPHLQQQQQQQQGHSLSPAPGPAASPSGAGGAASPRPQLVSRIGTAGPVLAGGGGANSCEPPRGAYADPRGQQHGHFRMQGGGAQSVSQPYPSAAGSAAPLFHVAPAAQSFTAGVPVAAVQPPPPVQYVDQFGRPVAPPLHYHHHQPPQRPGQQPWGSPSNVAPPRQEPAASMAPPRAEPASAPPREPQNPQGGPAGAQAGGPVGVSLRNTIAGAAGRAGAPVQPGPALGSGGPSAGGGGGGGVQLGATGSVMAGAAGAGDALSYATEGMMQDGTAFAAGGGCYTTGDTAYSYEYSAQQKGDLKGNAENLAKAVEVYGAGSDDDCIAEMTTAVGSTAQIFRARARHRELAAAERRLLAQQQGSARDSAASPVFPVTPPSTPTPGSTATAGASAAAGGSVTLAFAATSTLGGGGGASRSGGLSISELPAGCSIPRALVIPGALVDEASRGPLEGKARSVFRQLDAGGRGFVTADEFIAGICRELGLPPAAAAAALGAAGEGSATGAAGSKTSSQAGAAAGGKSSAPGSAAASRTSVPLSAGSSKTSAAASSVKSSAGMAAEGKAAAAGSAGASRTSSAGGKQSASASKTSDAAVAEAEADAAGSEVQAGDSQTAAAAAVPATGGSTADASSSATSSARDPGAPPVPPAPRALPIDELTAEVLRRLFEHAAALSASRDEMVARRTAVAELAAAEAAEAKTRGAVVREERRSARSVERERAQARAGAAAAGGGEDTEDRGAEASAEPEPDVKEATEEAAVPAGDVALPKGRKGRKQKQKQQREQQQKPQQRPVWVPPGTPSLNSSVSSAISGEHPQAARPKGTPHTGKAAAAAAAGDQQQQRGEDDAAGAGALVPVPDGLLADEGGFVQLAALYPLLTDCCFYRRAYARQDAEAAARLASDRTAARRHEGDAAVATNGEKEATAAARDLEALITKLQEQWNTAHAAAAEAKRVAADREGRRDRAAAAKAAAAERRTRCDREREASVSRLAVAAEAETAAAAHKGEAAAELAAAEERLEEARRVLAAAEAAAAAGRQAFAEASGSYAAERAALDRAEAEAAAAEKSLEAAVAAAEGAEKEAEEAEAAAAEALAAMEAAEAAAAACEDPTPKAPHLLELRERAATLAAEAGRLRLVAAQYRYNASCRAKALTVAREARRREVDKETRLVGHEVVVASRRAAVAAREAALRERGRVLRATHREALVEASACRNVVVSSMHRETSSHAAAGLESLAAEAAAAAAAGAKAGAGGAEAKDNDSQGSGEQRPAKAVEQPKGNAAGEGADDEAAEAQR